MIWPAAVVAVVPCAKGDAAAGKKPGAAAAGWFTIMPCGVR